MELHKKNKDIAQLLENLFISDKEDLKNFISDKKISLRDIYKHLTIKLNKEELDTKEYTRLIQKSFSLFN